MLNIHKRASVRKKNLQPSNAIGEAVLAALRRLSNEAFETLVRFERKRRSFASGLYQQERHRHSKPYGLTRNDRLQVTRRNSPEWRS